MGVYVLGISGASGVLYGVRALEVLAQAGHTIHLIVSDGARHVARHEMALDLDGRVEQVAGDVVLHAESDTAGWPASGSFRHDGMLIVPASLKTTAAIAHGYADSLLTRSAIVCLKESRRLVIVPRETPLDLITLRNWATLKEAGARLVPAMPGFYHRPSTIEDLVDHVVGKALDQLDVAHDLFTRWGPELRPKKSAASR
ncbi:MAG: UbiX family flavin prenyltransferase [Euryarchaeota archaeon]|nr:UbiX family flavin prenyltransferase [Euryarchaeota archaeon]